jgi:S1-C subfamily serine protease
MKLSHSIFFIAASLSTLVLAPIASAFPNGSQSLVLKKVSSSGLIQKVSEGFSSQPELLPSTVTGAWDSTFMILLDEPTKYVYGTAFLVKKDVGRVSTVLYFLTNRHVIADYCEANKICPNAFLAQKANMVHQSDGLHLESLSGVFKDVEVVSLSKNPDLALLRVSVPADAKNLPEPLRISPTCEMKIGERLFTIGFSDPFYRTYPGSLPIADQKSIFKRWSKGIFTGYTKSDDRNDENTNHWIGTSVDGLEGGSGGPVLNENGQVVGAIKNLASLRSNQYRYDGNENADHLDWQSNAVECRYLSKFISDSIESKY